MAKQAYRAAPIASRLIERRNVLMMTQKEAADALGVSVRIYQAWEWGDVKNPQPRKRRRIEAWLNEEAT